jgi:hypothetical protein
LIVVDLELVTEPIIEPETLRSVNSVKKPTMVHEYEYTDTLRSTSEFTAWANAANGISGCEST